MVNGGFIIIERGALAFEYRPDLILERDILPTLAANGEPAQELPQPGLIVPQDHPPPAASSAFIPPY